MDKKWPKLIIIDAIGIAIGDHEKIINIVNDTIKRNGIITEKWVIRELIGKPIPNVVEIACQRWLKDPNTKLIETIKTEIIQQLRVSFTEKDNSQIPKDIVKFLEAAKSNNCKIVGISWLPSFETKEIFERSLLNRYFNRWISYDEVPRFHPFPDVIHKISQNEAINDPSLIANVGISKISLLSAYHAQCNWNILLATNNESDWSAYPYTHFVDITTNLINVFQPSPISSKRKFKSLFKKGNSQ